MTMVEQEQFTPLRKHQLDIGLAESVVHLVTLELIRATHLNGTFGTLHEGWAVLKEEEDELWDEIKKREPAMDLVLKEAVQTAAMAVRLIHDLIPRDFIMAAEIFAAKRAEE